MNHILKAETYARVHTRRRKMRKKKKKQRRTEEVLEKFEWEMYREEKKEKGESKTYGL